MKNKFKPGMLVTWGSGSPVAKIVTLAPGDFVKPGDLANSWAELVLVEPVIGSCGFKSWPAGAHICMPISALRIRIEN